MVNFLDMLRSLARIGVWDIVLPFMLVFTLVYATLTSVMKSMFGKHKDSEGKTVDNSKYAIIVAMVIAFGVVIPHATNSYPAGMDVVDIINKSLPDVAVIAVALVGCMILLGMFGFNQLKFEAGGISVFIVFIAIALIIYIFGSSAGWGWTIPYWLNFLNDPDTMTLLITILVFGVIVWFITKEKSDNNIKDSLGNFNSALFGPYDGKKKEGE